MCVYVCKYVFLTVLIELIYELHCQFSIYEAFVNRAVHLT